ncbi:MAG: metallophosphoesterase family protein [Pseudomonadota bacterium]
MQKRQYTNQYDLSKYSDAKIGVLSDTHSYINPKIAAHLADCDIILHAGDIGSFTVIKQLREICKDVICVCGNNDNAWQWHQGEHNELKTIPQIAEVSLAGGMIIITHGDEYYADYESWHTQLRENFSNAKAIVYGHSHRFVCDQSQQPWVLNPGAAGETRTQKHGVSCLHIYTDSQDWKVKEIRA